MSLNPLRWFRGRRGPSPEAIAAYRAANCEARQAREAADAQRARLPAAQELAAALRAHNTANHFAEFVLQAGAQRYGGGNNQRGT